MYKIKIDNLNYYYDTPQGNKLHVLKNLNLKIKEGDFVVVLGESGCGKTTFLNILAGIISANEGNVSIDNQQVTGPHFSRSFIFQQPCLLPWLNVRDNILFGCRLRKEKKDICNLINKYLDLLGLTEFENNYPSNLSHGMAQRVAFARSLINQPDILLLDEPFTALDFHNRNKIQSELIRTWLFEHFTIIFVTHDINEAISLGRRIVLLGNKPSTIEEIFDVDFKYPRDLYNKDLLELKLDIQDKFEQIIKRSVKNDVLE